MHEFNEYVVSLLKDTNLKHKEQEKLKKELMEQLKSLKCEYINKGFLEGEAIQKAIEEFEGSGYFKNKYNFSNDKQVNGFNLSYFIRTNLILIIVYLFLNVISFSLVKKVSKFNIIYICIITFILLLNYICATISFKSKKDIVKNMTLVAFSFFFLEKINIISISYLYKTIYNKVYINIYSIYIFKIKNIAMYILIIIFTILLTVCSNKKFKHKISMSILDIIILFFSILLNLLYFLFPNRFYLFKLIVCKFFNIDIKTLTKNFLYMNINKSIVIINIGLLVLVFFIIYKIIYKGLKRKS
ncbi:hypothetical protein [Hathewaya limosa]|uniref:Uncharacterized protein n=1 Tax=Hathewaya limosa TaxID=1536 RepID=A0ABU0JUG0_HATLI|nr:hypothetical protein [Hathewaya limosa]MDQ0480704.1 hypothetical protein [Hathewaya limosa]